MDAAVFLCLNRDVRRGRLRAALALLAALAVDGVVRLQLSVRLLAAGQGTEDPVPGLPVGTAWIRPPPGAVLQQAGAGGLWGCSYLGLACHSFRSAFELGPGSFRQDFSRLIIFQGFLLLGCHRPGGRPRLC